MMKKDFGGKHARNGEGPLWQFAEANDGSFKAPGAEYVSRLFFPVFNRKGMKSSVTPELKGDICSDFNHYHSIPVVTEDLHRVLNNRNVWVTVPGNEPWSATGNSAGQRASRWSESTREESNVEGELGVFTLERYNPEAGIHSRISIFVPPTDDYVELMTIRVTNESEKNLPLTLFTATPIYGRTADNLRDHRNVTSMFIINEQDEHGVRIRPKINFNEFGHSDNDTVYSVLGFTADGGKPDRIWSTVKDFIGEGGSFDCPEALYHDKAPTSPDPRQRNGYESIGALRFPAIELKPGESAEYVIIHGICDDATEIDRWKKEYGDAAKAGRRLDETRKYWQQLVNKVRFDTKEPVFNNWTKWINYQLFCRQVYGNSYLPDFGYGRGGRGWRDLFSDLLSIFLIDPESAGNEIINNFRGVRVDGTNATIVGTKPGEFKADRNNVPRTWCDHGTWPFFVLNFYIQQTGDVDVLFREIPYWKDQFAFRSKKTDPDWDESMGFEQLDDKGDVYQGTLLEHVLLEQLCSFFNVGSHNNILLEGADWNDTYDMARNRGESVCFYNWYGGNLREIADLLRWLKENKGLHKVRFLREATMLFDKLDGQGIDYTSPDKRKSLLMDYYEKVRHAVSGEKTELPVDKVIRDLDAKADQVVSHIRTKEWIETGEGTSFYNGHYDDNENRVHGEHPTGIRIDLTSQVLPIIFGTATEKQIPAMMGSIRKYLRDPSTGGLRLCSEFKEDKLYFGRLTGFAFGHKEHGGKWMQQNVMLMYGLYRRGFVNEGWEVYQDVYKLCNDSATSKIFPGIPSYFENDGHGAYHYLTGSATWLMFGLVTQMFGLRGSWGDLVIHPRLKKEQFDESGSIAIRITFREMNLNVTFRNPEGKEWDEYRVTKVMINGRQVEAEGGAKVKIAFGDLKKYCGKEENEVEVVLGES